MMMLAAAKAREGDRERALKMVQHTVNNRPDLTREGAIEIALLRALRRQPEATKRLEYWKHQDPTSSLLRYEAMRLGQSDPNLLSHIAADPERILEIATDYMHFGLYEDALDVLSRQYPSGPAVVGEPGVLHPSSYPLIAYYRGFCRYYSGQDGRADFSAASRMPTNYVFPNRPESFAVLHRAIEIDPNDASAHFLLGSIYLSGAMTGPALQEWETAGRREGSRPSKLSKSAIRPCGTGVSPRTTAGRGRRLRSGGASTGESILRTRRRRSKRPPDLYCDQAGARQ